MRIVQVSDVLWRISQQHPDIQLGLLGEREGEYLFYSLKALVMQGSEAPDVRLVFVWPNAFYSTEFFTTLFGFMADDEQVEQFGQLLRQSDLGEQDELCRLTTLAFERINSDELVA